MSASNAWVARSLLCLAHKGGKMVRLWPCRPRLRARFLAMIFLFPLAVATLSILVDRPGYAAWRGRRFARDWCQPSYIGADKSAIRQVLDAQAAAWNKGDLEGFMAGYWESPDLTFSSGKEQARGWQATYQRYRKRYQAEGREMGRLTFSELTIEVLGADSAFVRGRYSVVTSKETLGGVFTLIFKRLPEGWRIIHDHTSG